MDDIVRPAAPAVNPAPAPSVVMTDAEFSAFCAAQWSPDNAPTGPTLREEYEEAGQRFGLAGRLMDVAAAFPDATARDLMRGAHPFAEGQYHGFREFARKLGYDLGLDGKPMDRPESIPSRFELVFECGWHSGDSERAAREIEMAAYFERLDWEYEYERAFEEENRVNHELFYGRKPFGVVMA